MAMLIRRSPLKEHPKPQVAKGGIPSLTKGGLSGLGELVDPPKNVGKKGKKY